MDAYWLAIYYNLNYYIIIYYFVADSLVSKET